MLRPDVSAVQPLTELVDQMAYESSLVMVIVGLVAVVGIVLYVLWLTGIGHALVTFVTRDWSALVGVWLVTAYEAYRIWPLDVPLWVMVVWLLTYVALMLMVVWIVSIGCSLVLRQVRRMYV